MENEDKKGFGRFYFSTELDRGDQPETSTFFVPEGVGPVEEVPTEKKKSNNRRNRRNRRNKKPNHNKTVPQKLTTVIPYDDALSTVEENATVEEYNVVPEEMPVEEVPMVDFQVFQEEPEEAVSNPMEDAPVAENTSEEIAPEEVPQPEVEEVPEEVVEEPVTEEIPITEEAPVEEAVPEEEVSKEAVEEAAPTEEVVEAEPEVIATEVVEETPVAKKAVPEEKTSTVIPYNDSLSTVTSEEEVALEDELSSLREKGISLDEARDINLDHTLYRDQYFIQNVEGKDEVVDEVKEAIANENGEESTPPTDIRMVRKVYLNFQARVILLSIGVLLLFGFACFLIVSTLRNNEIQKVNYIESSTIHYDVCQSSDNPFNTVCLKEDKTYPESSSNLHVDYHYEAKFDEEVPYDLSYHVVVVNKIYDHYDTNKVSYEDEDLLIDKTQVPKGKNPATFDVNVEVDYQKYQQFVKEYKERYSANSDASMNVILYLDDGTDTRNVGELVIPLGVDHFEITKQESKDSKQVYSVVSKDWTNTNTLYVIIGSIFVLLSLFLLFHLTKLVLSITGKKSKYQEYLMSLLNEYDRLIVIARDGYESNIEKQVIKVYTFDELLNARSLLNKPIIYSRINNVKSEFIVEDEDVIYKYILKEADMVQ